jgi:ribonucleoside-diphosphate reductase alpha chain
MEVFAQLGKGGDLANSDLEAICRMVSLWLRAGGGLDHVIRQLHSIGSSLQVQTKEGKIMSLGDGLARGLKKYTKAKEAHGLRSLLLGNSATAADARPASAVPSTKAAELPGRPNPHGSNGGTNGGNGNGGSKPVRRTLDTLGMQWQQAQYKVVCPDCQGDLRFGEGCMTCEECGYSKC